MECWGSGVMEGWSDGVGGCWGGPNSAKASMGAFGGVMGCAGEGRVEPGSALEVVLSTSLAMLWEAPLGCGKTGSGPEDCTETCPNLGF